jgi:hypothetical protein
MYRVERTNDEGQTWTEAYATTDASFDQTLEAWDRYCELSEAERVRLIKDGRVISTSHVDDEPLYPEGTPEYEAYAAKLRVALAEPGAWDFLADLPKEL